MASNARAAHARTGEFACLTTLVSRVDAKPILSKMHVSGTSYEFKRGNFHRSLAIGLTITLVTKFDQHDDVKARIICPHDSELVHAFSNSNVDTAAIIRDAQEALMCT